VISRLYVLSRARFIGLITFTITQASVSSIMVEWFVDVSFVSFDTLNDSSEIKTDCVSEASFRMLNMSAAWGTTE